MKKRKTIFLIIISIAVMGAVGFGINFWLRNKQYQDAIKNLSIDEIDLTKLENGEYIGEFDVDFISAKVKVTITDHTISNIEYIYHHNDKGKNANIITSNMIQQQKIKVDTISGATNSSKVIQKAVERALSKQ